MAPYYLKTQVLIVVTILTLYNYIKHEDQRNWLFEKHSSKKIIVIGSNDEDDNKMLAGFTLSHVDSETDLF